MLGFGVRGELVTYPRDGLAVDEYIRGTIDYRGGQLHNLVYSLLSCRSWLCSLLLP